MATAYNVCEAEARALDMLPLEYRIVDHNGIVRIEVSAGSVEPAYLWRCVKDADESFKTTVDGGVSLYAGKYRDGSVLIISTIE